MRRDLVGRLTRLARSLPAKRRLAVWNPAIRRYVIPNTDPEVIVKPEDLEATGVHWTLLGGDTPAGDWLHAALNRGPVPEPRYEYDQSDEGL